MINDEVFIGNLCNDYAVKSFTFEANKEYKLSYTINYSGSEEFSSANVAIIGYARLGARIYQFENSCYGHEQVVDTPVLISISEPGRAPEIIVKQSFSNKIKVFSGIFLGFCCISVILNIMSPLFFKSPTISVYSVVCYFQCMILTPLLGIYMHSEVKSFFEYLNFMLFNFSFLPNVVIFVDDSSTRPRQLMEQRNEYLDMIGLESGSALYDMGKLIFVAFLVLGVYSVVTAAYLLTMANTTESKFYKFIKGVFDAFTFSVFIRFYLLAYTYILLCIFSDIAINNRRAGTEGTYIFAWFALVGCVCFFAATCVQWVLSKTHPETFKKLHRFNEAFRGLKENWSAHSYPLVFMLRNFFFVVLVCSLDTESKWVKISLFFTSQVFYIIYLIAVRPFLNWKEFIIEMFNSCMFLLALFCLFFLDSSKRFTSKVSDMYLWYIIVSAIVSSAIVVIWIYLQIFSKRVRWRESAKKCEEDVVVATQKPDLEDDEDQGEEKKERSDDEPATPDALKDKPSPIVLSASNYASISNDIETPPTGTRSESMNKKDRKINQLNDLNKPNHILR